MHNQDTSEASREQRGRSQHRTRNCTADIGSPVTIRHGIYNYNYNYNYNYRPVSYTHLTLPTILRV